MTLYGGGYDEVGNPSSGALTVTARVSNGASRHAMPSISVSDFDYAALFYKGDDSPENPPSKDFVEGTAGENGKLIFSFQKPDDTSGEFTLEVFAFVKTADESTKVFSKESAILSGKAAGLKIDGDEIKINEAIPLSSTKPGTVNLKIQVPSECSLSISEIDENGVTVVESKSHFTVTGTSPNFVLTQKDASGIPAGAYPVTFTVKKGGEIVSVFSECINVINGLCTDTWNGSEKGAAKEITQGMISSTVYVRGTGGWYDTTSPYNEGATATASDANSGSFLSPLATIQKAVDKIIAINDGASAYTIYVDGTLQCDDSTYTGANGMADFSALGKNLKLTIKALSGTATLDANGKSRVMYAKPASGALNLTLENLVITGGNTASSNGGAMYISTTAEVSMTGVDIRGNKASAAGGAYVVGGTLEMKDCKVEENTATSSNAGGIRIASGGTVIMDGGTISGNRVEGSTSNTNHGGGVYVASTGTFTMKGDATISGNILSENATNRYGGEVYVYSSMFEMEDGTISGGNATNGGGVYVSGANSNFTMSGGTIRENTATSNGGGVSIGSGGKFTMKGSTSTISDNNADGSGGGVCVAASGDTFTMEGGTISGNTATSEGGGVCNYGTFSMSGSASIPAGNDGKNDVYLASGKTITVAGALTAASPVATITLPASEYKPNKQVLSAGSGVTITQAICNKFKMKDTGRIKPDGNTKGVLYWEIGDTGPGGGLVFYNDANGFTVNVKTCYYFECSKDSLGSINWCVCSGCSVSTSDEIGKGCDNTQNILSITKHSDVTASNCAAKACAEYSTSTTTAGEWFLPNLEEAKKIYNIGSITGSLWTSSASVNNLSAYYVTASNNNTAFKAIPRDVRAVRAF